VALRGAHPYRVFHRGREGRAPSRPERLCKLLGGAVIKIGDNDLLVQLTDASTVGGKLSVTSSADGVNSIVITEGSTVGGSLRAKSSDGLNGVSVTDGGTIGGRLSAKNGSGGGVTTVSDSTVTGDLSVKCKDGPDIVTLSNSVVGGRTSIDYGAGLSRTTISPATLTGNVRIRAKGGTGTVTLSGVTVGGRTAISLGDSGNTVGINDCTFTGAFTARLGNDADTLDIETAGADDGPHTVFADSVRVATGDGDDEVSVGVSAEDGNSAEFAAGVKKLLDGGAGDDTLHILTGGNVGTADITIRNFETTD